jgi:hypothetical protein
MSVVRAPGLRSSRIRVFVSSQQQCASQGSRRLVTRGSLVRRPYLGLHQRRACAVSANHLRNHYAIEHSLRNEAGTRNGMVWAATPWN